MIYKTQIEKRMEKRISELELQYASLSKKETEIRQALNACRYLESKKTCISSQTRREMLAVMELQEEEEPQENPFTLTPDEIETHISETIEEKKELINRISKAETCIIFNHILILAASVFIYSRLG
jgi:ATPase subunit of ABC transporter with duplicated ATPase domains